MLKVYHEAKINGKTHRYLLCQEFQLFQPTKCLSLPLSIFAKMMDLFETDREFIIFQDVVYALAHATGKTGRFTLIERWRNNERLLAPQEHPLKVMAT